MTTPIATNENPEISPEERYRIPESEAKTAYHSVEMHLRAIPADALKSLRYSAGEAMARGLYVAENAAHDRTLFEEIYKKPPLAEIDGLRPAALAVKGASLLANAPVTPVTPTDIEQARQSRKSLIYRLRGIFYNEPKILEEIEAIEEGRGNRDLGNDLVDISALATIPARWQKIAASQLITQAEIEDSEQLGMRILVSLDNPRGKAKPKDPSRELERRAWTYLAQLYDVVRDHAYVLYRVDKSVWENDYPSLFAANVSYQSSTKKSKTSPSKNP